MFKPKIFTTVVARPLVEAGRFDVPRVKGEPSQFAPSVGSVVPTQAGLFGFVRQGSVTGVGPSQLTTHGFGFQFGGAGAGVTVSQAMGRVIE